MTGIRIPTALLTLSLAGCHGPSPTQPLNEGRELRVDVDVWEGTRWGQLLREAKHLGSRAELLGMVAGKGLEVRSAAPHAWPVFTSPTCSVPADPSAGEARSYLKCVYRERADRSHRHPLDEYFFYEMPESRPRHLLTFEADTGMWHLWTIFWNGCGNAHHEAEELGIVQRR